MQLVWRINDTDLHVVVQMELRGIIVAGGYNGSSKDTLIMSNHSCIRRKCDLTLVICHNWCLTQQWKLVLNFVWRLDLAANPSINNIEDINNNCKCGNAVDFG